VYDLFDKLLNLVYQHFLGKNLHLFCVALSGFGMSVILTLKNEFGSVPSLSISWKSFKGCWYYFFLKKK
jgi:hypothetical protein